MAGGQENIEAAFRKAIASEQTSESIVQQYVLHGQCDAVSDEQHFKVKAQIAEKYDLEVNRDVFVVGSAKLGFSIAPSKRYRPFGDQSDVDVAIISHELYQFVWHRIHEFMESKAYWPKRADFERYSAWGWDPTRYVSRLGSIRVRR